MLVTWIKGTFGGEAAEVRSPDEASGSRSSRKPFAAGRAGGWRGHAGTDHASGLRPPAQSQRRRRVVSLEPSAPSEQPATVHCYVPFS